MSGARLPLPYNGFIVCTGTSLTLALPAWYEGTKTFTRLHCEPCSFVSHIHLYFCNTCFDIIQFVCKGVKGSYLVHFSKHWVFNVISVQMYSSCSEIGYVCICNVLCSVQFW
jgi:hypothetical protein